MNGKNTFMIKLISSDELSFRCMKEKCVILITDDFVGHRLDWLNEFNSKVSECGLILIVITLDMNRIDSRFSERKGGPVFCNEFSSRSEVIKFLDSRIDSSQTVSFWDAELWIKELSKLKFRSQLLFMRPYASDLSLRAIVNFMLKMSSMFYFKYVRGHSIGLLAVPLNRRIFFDRNQVYDELLLGKYHISKAKTNLNRLKTTVPKLVHTIIVPGYISMRKNPFLIVEVGKKLASTSDFNFRIIFQGQLDKEIECKLKSQSLDWLFVNDEYTTLENFLEAIHQSTIVLLPYSNRGSSGIVLQAQYLGKRVILSKNRLWKNVAKRSGESIILTKLSINEITQSILNACGNREIPSNLIENDFEKGTAFSFLMGHSNVINSCSPWRTRQKEM